MGVGLEKSFLRILRIRYSGKLCVCEMNTSTNTFTPSSQTHTYIHPYTHPHTTIHSHNSHTNSHTPEVAEGDAWLWYIDPRHPDLEILEREKEREKERKRE